MTINELVEEYRSIHSFLNQNWPLKNKDQRVFARTMKIMEELGELSDELLSSMNLQRGTKLQAFSAQNVVDEFADVLACLVLLGIELDIDIEKAITEKIAFTRDRLEIDN